MFGGEKSKFEDFWDMFLSLVDQGVEPTNIKMARLRQSLTGTALEAIRGLGVSDSVQRSQGNSPVEIWW